jgi:ADP-ribose pyrophosphatase
MADLERYLALARAYPQRFANQPGGIDILLDPVAIQQAQDTIAQQLSLSGAPVEWSEVGVAFQDQYLMILRDAVRFPDGQLGTYIRITGMEDGVPGVIILPIYQGQVLLVRHFRHALRDWMIELPRGFGEKGLLPEENARRELREELGAEVGQLISLGPVHPDASMVAGYDTLFFAELTSLGVPDQHEGIAEVRTVTLGDFERMIGSGEITDGYTLAAYSRAKLRGLLK